MRQKLPGLNRGPDTPAGGAGARFGEGSVAEKNVTIITCGCGQKMKAPAASRGKVFKCVRCGAHIRPEQQNASEAPPPPPQDAVSQDAPKATEPIGQLLVAEGLVSEDQLNEALAHQRGKGGKTFQILIERGYLSPEDLHSFLSRQPGVAAIDITRFDIEREILQLLPREMVLEHLVLPIDRLGRLLSVAMACPLDIATITAIERHTGLKVKSLLARLSDIQAAVAQHYPEGGSGGVHTFKLPEQQGAQRQMAVGKRIESLESFPVQPDLAELLVSMANDAGSSARDIAAVVSSDPVLGALLLRTANLSAYGMPGQVDSVALATALLGKKGVGELAARARSEEAWGDAIAALRGRAQRRANAAAALARASGLAGSGTAYTAGLLAELGCFALAALAPDKYVQIHPELGGVERAEAEKQLFTMVYPEAGATLGVQWGFPENLCTVLRYQLMPEGAGEWRDLASIVRIATVAAVHGAKLSTEPLADCEAAMAQLEMDPERIVEAVREAVEN